MTRPARHPNKIARCSLAAIAFWAAVAGIIWGLHIGLIVAVVAAPAWMVGFSDGDEARRWHVTRWSRGG